MLASAVTIKNKNMLVFIMLLARRPLDAIPDAKHQAEIVGLSPLRIFAKCGSRGFNPLVRDEPPMTACGGDLIGGAYRRNEQCLH